MLVCKFPLLFFKELDCRHFAVSLESQCFHDLSIEPFFVFDLEVAGRLSPDESKILKFIQQFIPQSQQRFLGISSCNDLLPCLFLILHEQLLLQPPSISLI